MNDTTHTPAEQLEQQCLQLSDARHDLRGIVDRIRATVRGVVEQFRDELRAALDQASSAQTGLEGFVAGHPALFEKPRTRDLHGIRVGFRKLPGRVDFESEPRVVELVKDKLPERYRDLIQVRETVRKDVLVTLAARELAALGCSLVDAGDQVVVRATDTDLDRLIKGLLDDAGVAADLGLQAEGTTP